MTTRAAWWMMMMTPAAKPDCLGEIPGLMRNTILRGGSFRQRSAAGIAADATTMSYTQVAAVPLHRQLQRVTRIVMGRILSARDIGRGRRGFGTPAGDP